MGVVVWTGAGVGGADISSESKGSLPNASNNSACFVFLLPSFIPLPLNAGVRTDAGAGDAFRAGTGEGASKRETGE